MQGVLLRTTLLPAASCCFLLLPAASCCFLLLPIAFCCFLLLPLTPLILLPNHRPQGFYAGHKHITSLTEKLWERRVGQTDTVWIIEFYAPWCSHCQSLVEDYKQAASLAATRAEEAGGRGLSTSVEFGAINCVVDTKVSEC